MSNIEVPDEAISFITSRFMFEKSGEFPIVVGISAEATELVLSLFFEWAEKNNYIKDNLFVFGGKKVL